MDFRGNSAVIGETATHVRKKHRKFTFAITNNLFDKQPDRF